MAKLIEVRQSVVIEIDNNEGKALYKILDELEQECKGATRAYRSDCSRALTSVKTVLKKYYDELPF